MRMADNTASLLLGTKNACVSPPNLPMSGDQRGTVVRDIRASDFDTVAELLGKRIGYHPKFYLDIFRVMATHATPEGYPKYGRVLESDGSTVGAIILIFSTIHSDFGPRVRCHVTGWCVEPDFRPYAALFFARDLKHGDVTYVNLYARSTPETLPIIAVQGFTKYVDGQFIAPTLQAAFGAGKAKIVSANETPSAPFEPFEQKLLTEHASYGCLCFWCVTPERAYPFVFRPRLFKGFIPGVQLVYCRDIDDLRRLFTPIGRFLALQGRFVARVNSNGPIRGLIGKFEADKDCRYFKGTKPRLGDLAYTATAMSAYVPRKKPGGRKSPLIIGWFHNIVASRFNHVHKVGHF